MAATKDDLLRMTVEITVAAVSGYADETIPLPGAKGSVPDFMQAVHEKLKELSELD